MCGSSIDVGAKVRSKAKAIIHAWYPGSTGGLAIANLIAGEYSPCGKLPVTIYNENHDLPDFLDYNMQGKTYRYIKGDALYPFGYGLSYTSFAYSNAKILESNENALKISVEITNTGDFKGFEKAQAYAKFTDSRTYTPHFQLCGINSVELDKGETATVIFDIDTYWLKAVNENGERITPDGELKLYIGGHQPDAVSNKLLGYECLEINLK